MINSVSKQGPRLAAIEEDGVTRHLYNLNLFAKPMVLLRQLLLNLAIAATAKAILMRISAELADRADGTIVLTLLEVAFLW